MRLPIRSVTTPGSASCPRCIAKVREIVLGDLAQDAKATPRSPSRSSDSNAPRLILTKNQRTDSRVKSAKEDVSNYTLRRVATP